MRNHRMYLLILSATALLLAMEGPQAALAQENQVNRKWGLGASLQGGQTAVFVPIWLSPTFMLAPTASLNYVENTSTTIGAGVFVKIFPHMARIAPFWGLGATTSTVIISGGGGSNTTIIPAVFFGGEFFINQRFSFGVQPTVAVVIPPNSGPLQINTATLLYATIFF